MEDCSFARRILLTPCSSLILLMGFSYGSGWTLLCICSGCDMDQC
jgi:hypothetical protein